MATKERSSKPRRRPNRTAKGSNKRNKRSASDPFAESADGGRIPDALSQTIEAERENLLKAETVLACLVISMQYESDLTPKPYYPDVAQIARQLIRQAINGLDSLNLDRCLSRNRIEEATDWREFGAFPLTVGSIPVATYH
jgi:hypothetical protein